MATSRSSQIGYDTNSKDIDRQKSRVFVAGLNTSVTRDMIIELFASYGHITGATLFKGYAFVQYSNSTEADLATMALNGYTWQKGMLEVKVAFDPSKGGDLMPMKRAKREQNGPPEKRAKIERQEPVSIQPSAPVFEQPQPSTIVQQQVSFNSANNEIIPDTFICGGCRFYSNSFESFFDHRQIPCSKKPHKPEGEPEVFRCFTCSNAFNTSWELLYHLRVAHEITMYKIAKT